MRKLSMTLLFAAVLIAGPIIISIEDTDLSGTASAADEIIIWDVIDSYSTSISIMPGDTFNVRYDSASLDILGGEEDTLADACYKSLEIIPGWLRSNLTHKFRLLSETDQITLSNLIINSPDDRYIDEIAFCIAHSSVETLRDDNFFPQLFTHNANLIYRSDEFLDYVEVVDLEDHTTLRYTAEDNSTWDLPMDIYYWYVVHPKLGDELPTYVDPQYNYVTDPPFDRNHGTAPPVGKYWRDWLFNNNKTGQPILRDSLSEAGTLLGGIKAINGWMGASMSFTSDNERPVQPVRIYEKGIGRCGEYQDMRCAAARAALIPVVPTMNSAEDHVWNEFWDGRWIHWDGAIDNPMMYENGWGKTISSVWNMRGDGYSWSVTERYSTTCTVTARVVDSNGLPADGALVALETENYYQNDLKTTTIWDSVSYDGNVTIEIGDGRNFWASAEGYDLGQDPPGILGPELIISDSVEDENYEVRFELPQAAPSLSVIESSGEPTTGGPYRIELDYRVENNILRGRNRMTGDRYDLFGLGGDIDFFIADDMNFRAYERGLAFMGYEVSERSSAGSMGFNTSTTGNWYAVLSNEFSQWTTKIVNITVKVYGYIEASIADPLEDGTHHSIGEILEITGTAYSPWGIDNVDVSWDDGMTWHPASDISGAEPAYATWSYQIDTNGLAPGDRGITVSIDDGDHSVLLRRNITLMDVTPPEIHLSGPVDGVDLGPGEMVTVWGTVSDENGVVLISCEIDGRSEGEIEYTDIHPIRNWSFTLDTTFMDPGEREVTVTATDTSGNSESTTVRIDVGESIPPKVRIMEPDDGILFKQGDTISVSGMVTDNVGATRLFVRLDEGSDRDNSDGLTGEGFTIEVDTDRLSDGEHSITITAFDQDGNSGEDSMDIEIDAVDPYIELDDVWDGYYHMEGESLSISGRVLDDREVGSIWMTLDDGPIMDMTRYMRYGRFDIPLEKAKILDSGSHNILLTASDSVGNEADMAIDLVVDGDEPALHLDELPSIVMRGEEISITGYVMDPSGIGSAYLEISGFGRMDIVIMEDGFFAVFLDTSDLPVGEIEIILNARDMAGNTADMSTVFHAVTLSTDTDGDGIPDWWEELYFGLDPFVRDSDEDQDGDGYTNLEEYLGKDGKGGMDDYSDPTDPESRPVRSSGNGEIIDVLVIVIPIAIALMILIGIFLFTRSRRKSI